MIDQLIRCVFVVGHVGGDHGKAGHAASAGGDGAVTELDVGVIGLIKQGNGVIGAPLRLGFGDGWNLGFRRKGFCGDGGFSGGGLGHGGLRSAGAQPCNQ